MFMGPCIADIFPSIANNMHRYTIYLFLWNALHVSDGTSAHHQELKNCIYSIGYLSNLYCYLPLAASSSKVLTSIYCCIYSFWAPDDGRRHRLKHVEHFTEINKLCNVVSCWLYLEIYLRCSTDPWTSGSKKSALYGRYGTYHKRQQGQQCNSVLRRYFNK
jgi:hypothetical protein